MRFLSSHELNKNKWDALVGSAGGRHFSASFFLDATAKNWGVYTDENYSKGFALCYNEVLGIKLLYPPIFGRTVDFFNLDETELKQIPALLKKQFAVGYIQSETLLSFENKSEKTYQVYSPENKMSTLATRMLKKATGQGFSVRPAEFKHVLPLIKQELSGKIKELNPENLGRLEALLRALEAKNHLLCLGILDSQSRLCGGLFFARSEHRITYVLGTAQKDCRDNGGMYLCMQEAITQAASAGKMMDFGGSNIASIRRFYLALGGSDQRYFAWSWDKSPRWFRLLRNLKKKA